MSSKTIWNRCKYSVLAVRMNKALNKRDVEGVINDALDYFTQKGPSENIFKQAFSKNIVYTNKKSGQRKLIVYIFDKLERIRRGTRELKMDIVSLEHISSQSKTNESVVGMIGNLLPLCFSLNEDCKNYDITGSDRTTFNNLAYISRNERSAGVNLAPSKSPLLFQFRKLSTLQ